MRATGLCAATVLGSCLEWQTSLPERVPCMPMLRPAHCHNQLFWADPGQIWAAVSCGARACYTAPMC